MCVVIDEIELKLALSPEASTVLEASTLLGAPASRSILHSTYFDTPDKRLHQNGMSLRIRSDGDARVQTVKADNDHSIGLFTRSEWEMPIPGTVPILDGRNPIQSLLGHEVDAIGAIFTVEVERICWSVLRDGADIEVALDRGAVIAGERRQSFCEIELELKAGDPTALFALADHIDAIVPVRLGVLSKAERGYRLSAAGTPAGYNAEPMILAVDMTAASAFQAIVHACLRQYRLNEDMVLHDRQAEALHQSRVALRRLRSAFFIFKPMLPDAQAKHFRDELRWLCTALGAARDIDVLLARAPEGGLRDRLLSAREEAYTLVDATLASSRTRDLMRHLVAWISDGPWLRTPGITKDMPATEFAAGALDHIRKRLKKRGSALQEISDEDRHEARKRAKMLRYASEFSMSLFPHKRQRQRYISFIAALGALQDHLGALNDQVAALALLDQLGIAHGHEVRSMFPGGKRKGLIGAASKAFDKVMDAKKFWR
jgi:inorganic triphosphatase YgiF